MTKLILSCLVTLVPVVALGQDEHAQMHETYKLWRVPNNPSASCCSNQDCRPTRARVNDNGLWEAWNGQRWIVVPRDLTLPPDYAHDGRSHICEKDGQVYCFTPGEPKS